MCFLPKKVKNLSVIFKTLLLSTTVTFSTLIAADTDDFTVEIPRNRYDPTLFFVKIPSAPQIVKSDPKIAKPDPLKKTSLYYSDHRLTGDISEEIKELSGASIEEMKNLTYINFNNNHNLSGIIPKGIGDLSNLESLYLAYNKLTGEIPPAIGNLKNLKTLRLDNNQFTGNIPPEIGNLQNLNTLHLDNNKLTGDIPPEIGNLKSIKYLHLEKNQLTGEIPPEIGNLKKQNLNTLQLDNNKLTGKIPEEIWGVTSYLLLFGNFFFGEKIFINQRWHNPFFSIKNMQADELYSVTISSSSSSSFNSQFLCNFTDDGIWQEQLVNRSLSFTEFTPSLQAVFIAELANCGYGEKIEFIFPNNLGTLTIHPAEDTESRKIETSKDALLDDVVKALDNLHMPLGKFESRAKNGQPSAGLIYLGSSKPAKGAHNTPK